MIGEILPYVDKTGSAFRIGECGEEHTADLQEMYDTFSPKAISQGLPPANDKIRYDWVRRMLDRGINFAAWMESKIVGHSALICDLDKRDGEYIIFVTAAYRNRGLGSELTRMTVDKARNMGLTTLWLTVESYNFRAIHVYRKVGFAFCDEGELERTMILCL
ncbi:MAG TPA: GNAT family N-acetyltransferase [Desulfomonilaceae bacterium]|nr:GNAT family N-acetyltransferase [Desulfomonilaceae bacterium]